MTLERHSLDALKVEEILHQAAFAHALAPLKELGGVVEFSIAGPGGGHYWFDLATQAVSATQRAPQVIVRADISDFKALLVGSMSPEDGLLTERLHLAGDAARLFALMDVFERRVA